MTNKGKSQLEARQQVVYVSALDMLTKSNLKKSEDYSRPHCQDYESNNSNDDDHSAPLLFSPLADHAAICDLGFPFLLKSDQLDAVKAWMANHYRGSIIYGSGTGKTEIALECARQLAELKNADHIHRHFRIVLLVPRIVLVEQNYARLIRYGISAESIGKYFGEEKQIREITICTYHSALANLDIVSEADMIIFDEVHLASGAFSRIFDVVREDQSKALLGLTATIDENDPKNATIMNLLPPVRKYLIKDAVRDKRLARPIFLPIRVSLTKEEQVLYDSYSSKIRDISRRLKRYDAKDMMALMMLQGGFLRWQARAWFLNVKKRKRLLASSENKLKAAVDLIAEKHPGQKVMVFSETLESVKNLKHLLKSKGIESALIESRTPSLRRQKILSEWGKRFHVLLSVHTLEIGYDVPEARIEIILATTSNMNQIVQRIGRVLRIVEGKDSALVYMVYLSDTKDDNILSVVKGAIEASGRNPLERQDGTSN